MADIKISGLTTASQINNGDNIELSQDSGGGNLVSLKATILAVATKILKGINFTSDLQTTDKTIIGAINEAAQGGGGGSSSLAGLSDVDIDDQTLDDDQVLVWDSVNEKWVNADQSGQGGTTVVANPSGEATDDLLKVQIGSTIYDVTGGGSSDGGNQLKKVLLYRATQSESIVQLNQSMENFDLIELVVWYAYGSEIYTQNAIYNVQELIDSIGSNPEKRFTVNNDSYYCWYRVNDVDELQLMISNNDLKIQEVYGYRVEGSSALSGKSLVMKTKTYTGDGNSSYTLTLEADPVLMWFSGIGGDNANVTSFSIPIQAKVLHGDWSTSGSKGSLTDGVLSYNSTTKVLSISGGSGDMGNIYNYNGSANTLYYLVEETFNEFKDIAGTLEAGETTITLSDADITSNSTVQPFTDVFGLNPTNMVVTDGSVTLTFDAQQSDVRVKVRISSNCAVPVTNLSADDIAYDSNNSVKDMIDGKLFATDVVNTGSFTVNAGTYADKSMLIPVKSGYTPIGVISWQLRTAIGTLVKAVISQTGNDYYLDITVGNPGTGTINPNADFSVLYMKS